MKRWIQMLALVAISAAGARAQADWKPGTGPLMTRWAASVSPTNAHPEYPRPQMVRETWMNLNGLWDYAIREQHTGEDTLKFDGKILVPFPVESALSGVMRRLDEKSLLWYRRHFMLPEAWNGKRLLLHFGAVDWKATVLVNGREIGTHRGGYDPFTMDITGALKSEENELTVAVADPTEADQPRGKQSRKPEGIFYTPVSGIWQTAWMEPVPPAYIDQLKLVPDVDAKSLRLTAFVRGGRQGQRVRAIALDETGEIAGAEGTANEAFAIDIPSPRLWTPDQPFLYNLKVTLLDDSKPADAVESYFAMRKFGLGKDAKGRSRMMLNNQFVFQVGTLDQGFWPDGIYTAPTDEALRYDVETLKRLGFNMTRKHVKVEPQRWYYWCDKLGLIVWQDMPSGNNSTSESKKQFETELQQLIENLDNHPCIAMWVLFNEGWGQYDTERLTQWVKKLDTSRLVNNASGWTDKKVGDVIDMHNYPGPGSPRPEESRAAVLGEFGGLGLGIEGHTWAKRTWGYQGMADSEMLTSQYVKLLRKAWVLSEEPGMSAAVYTQTTDVETECNGIMTYDRAIVKMAADKIGPANRGELPALKMKTVVRCATSEAIEWRYTLEPPAPDWFKPGFDDSSWKTGNAGFGTQGTPNVVVRTVWNTGDIWIRRDFELGPASLKHPQLWMHHDDMAEVYINGTLASTGIGYVSDYEEAYIGPSAAKTLKPGRNTLAIHCHQTVGGQYIDAGIIDEE
jgi:hypothetical protein